MSSLVDLLKSTLRRDLRHLNGLQPLLMITNRFGVLDRLSVQLVQGLKLGFHDIVHVAHGSSLLVEDTRENERNSSLPILFWSARAVQNLW